AEPQKQPRHTPLLRHEDADQDGRHERGAPDDQDADECVSRRESGFGHDSIVAHAMPSLRVNSSTQTTESVLLPHGVVKIVTGRAESAARKELRVASILVLT